MLGCRSSRNTCCLLAGPRRHQHPDDDAAFARLRAPRSPPGSDPSGVKVASQLDVHVRPSSTPLRDPTLGASQLKLVEPRGGWYLEAKGTLRA